MWKTILMKFLAKAKVWLTETGLTNLIYLGLGFGIWLGIIPLLVFGFLKAYLVGAFFGIFIYLNWNIIVKLYKSTKIDDFVDDVKDKIEDKLDKDKIGVEKPITRDSGGPIIQ